MTKKKYVITESVLKKVLELDRSAYDRSEEIENLIRAKELTEEMVWMTSEEEEKRIREDERNKTMDEFGILYGEDAKRFNEYVNGPGEPISEEAKQLIKEARELSKKDRLK